MKHINNQTEKVFRIEIGYNGADITDIARIEYIPIRKIKWYLEMIENGCKKTNYGGWFINFGNKNDWRTINNRRSFQSYSQDKWPEPMLRDAI
jgi:hypothetical protein